LSKWITYEGQTRKTEQIYSPSITVTFQPQEDCHKIPTSPETLDLNPPTTEICEKTSYSSSTHYNRTLEDDPLYEFQPSKSNQIHHSFSNNKQSPPISKTIESINDTRTWNIRERESTNNGTVFSQESISNGSSTNRCKCIRCQQL